MDLPPFLPGLKASPSKETKPTQDTGLHAGRAYLVVATFFFVLSSLMLGMPGDYWPLLLPAFLFSLAGWIKARRSFIRVTGILLSGLTGGALLGDLAAWFV
jgi:hypothetical protein